MEEKKNWKERLGGYDSMEEAMFVTIDEKAVCAIDELKEFIQQELDRAMEEGFRNCYKEVLAMDSFGERMDMSRKESFRRLKNLLEDKIRLKLTIK